MSRTAHSQLPQELRGKHSCSENREFTSFTDRQQPRGSHLRVSFSSFQLLQGEKQEESDEAGDAADLTLYSWSFLLQGEAELQAEPTLTAPQHGIQPRRSVYTHTS